MKKLTLEEAIEKANEVHEGKYGYSKAKYNNRYEKTTFICPIHGEFRQTWNNHLMGYGCKKCAVDNLKRKRSLSPSELIERVREIHEDKYDYSVSTFGNMHTKTDILCKKHGIFRTTWMNHLRRSGCKECAKEERAKRNFERGLKKAREAHNGKYDYSLVEYDGNARKKVKIICPDHGVFEQMWKEHIKGRGCRKCARKLSAENRRYSLTDVINRANKIHNNKYDYSRNTRYKNGNTEAVIVCPIHGEFKQLWSSHLKGHGCPRCGVNRRVSNALSTSRNNVIKRANEIHDYKYDYSISLYNGVRSKTFIVCPIHGRFIQSWRDHLQGKGCSKCGYDRVADKKKYTLEHVINIANNKHGNKYDYCMNHNYEGTHTVASIICNKHGEFRQRWSNHIHGNGCPHCAGETSNQERALLSYVASIYRGEIVANTRRVIPPKELDIYLPGKNLAIEFNGSYWHSTARRDDAKWLHWNKTEACQKLGIRLIHVFEDDWLYRQEQVKDIVKYAISGPDKTIYGRKTKIEPITYQASSEFLDKYHIQGVTMGTCYLGIHLAGKLIGVCVFKKITDNTYELARYASKTGMSILGGLSKCLKHFLRENNHVKEVVSFCDRSIFSGGSYRAAGFKEERINDPDYKYIGNRQPDRMHKFNFRRARMEKMEGFDFDPDKSEFENAEANGYHRIYNAGLIKFIYSNK